MINYHLYCLGNNRRRAALYAFFIALPRYLLKELWNFCLVSMVSMMDITKFLSFSLSCAIKRSCSTLVLSSITTALGTDFFKASDTYTGSTTSETDAAPAKGLGAPVYVVNAMGARPGSSGSIQRVKYQAIR
jgi:hypothetical protein